MSANPNPLPHTVPPYDMPRRAHLDRHTPAEQSLHAALNAVEMLGADPKLTEAVTKLSEAKDLVADWLEGR